MHRTRERARQRRNAWRQMKLHGSLSEEARRKLDHDRALSRERSRRYRERKKQQMLPDDNLQGIQLQFEHVISGNS